MIASRRSSSERNPYLSQPMPLRRDELRPSTSRCIRDFLSEFPKAGEGTVLLIGGCDLLHFRLRVAQSWIRRDMLPSFWSHAAILRQRDKALWLVEAALDPDQGFRRLPGSNGVEEVPVQRYDDVERFPNLALLWFPTLGRPVDSAVEGVIRQRGLLDLNPLILNWLGYCWGVGAPQNPLPGGNGIPSAAFVEAVFASIGIDLTPGLSSRASSPEAIWHAALWWHTYYGGPPRPTGRRRKGQARAEKPKEHVPGRYWLGQKSAAVVSPGEGSSSPARDGARARPSTQARRT